MTASHATQMIKLENQAYMFRLAMRRMAATVCVISCTKDGRTQAMTATSVTSLSLEPPSLLACVNQWSAVHKAITKGQAFCINILSDSQQQIAKQCSQTSIDNSHFEQAPWQHDTSSGVTYLNGAQANIFCSLDQVITHTTHSIFIGLVNKIEMNDTVSPLIYLDGNYLPSKAILGKD